MTSKRKLGFIFFQDYIELQQVWAELLFYSYYRFYKNGSVLTAIAIGWKK